MVEALVVAIIMGVLAAVAIPSYTNYIRTQRREGAKSIAQAGAAAANIYYRRTGQNPPNVAALKLFLTDPARYTVNINTTSNNIEVVDVSSPSDTIMAIVSFR